MDILLIAGLWLDASAWDAVVPPLKARGHQATPVSLPGQGAPPADATLDDQHAAVVATVDSAADGVMVVGHSAAGTLAWMACDARPAKVGRVVMIGGFTSGEGQPYFDGAFGVEHGAMPFPGWEPFEGPDSADLDQDRRSAIAAAAIPVPEAVIQGTVHLRDRRRYDLPLTVICPEFSAAQARTLIDEGQVPELAGVRRIDYLDIDSGHWPMFTRPTELADLLADIADA